MEIEDSRYENSQRWGTYREKTKNELPKKLLVKLLENLKPGDAIELGPGAGIDSLYMLKNGWNVLGIDNAPETEEDIRQLIRKNEEELENRFSFINQKFEELQLPKDSCDLLVGFNSLFFCRPEKFKDFFQNLADAIRPGGYLLINLLGKNDDWNKTQSQEKTFLSREEILDLLKDFEINESGIRENELDKKTAVSQKIKHWHTFFICAKKK